MRRAIQQGRALGFEGDWLNDFTDRTIEMMGDAHPQVVAERDRIDRWVRAEEESFGRTLDRGTALLEEIVEKALSESNSWISADDAFQASRHLRLPLRPDPRNGRRAWPFGRRPGLRAADGAAAQPVPAATSAGPRAPTATSRSRHSPATALRASSSGYEFLRSETGIGALAQVDGSALAKLEQSPFYAEGGGQVADSGRLVWEGGEAEVTDVIRVGDDQVLELEIRWRRRIGLARRPERRSRPRSTATSRFRTMRNHTATHLLHAALRERLGSHVHQAGSAVRPDKLRFDFSHGEALTADDVAWVEDRVNGWIKDGDPVRWMVMEKPEAVKLGAMALFGEKYGDWVRVVEVENVSRELCGGTHVSNTAEIGIFKIVGESSSAANVRRIEAITGPDAIDWFRERASELDQVGHLLGDARDPVRAARDASEKLAEASEGAKKAARQQQGQLASDLAASTEDGRRLQGRPGGGAGRQSESRSLPSPNRFRLPPAVRRCWPGPTRNPARSAWSPC